VGGSVCRVDCLNPFAELAVYGDGGAHVESVVWVSEGRKGMNGYIYFSVEHEPVA
jgi:hypothetical protein